VPRAVGVASRMQEEAAGYKERIVAQAQGDGQRFSSLQAEYQKAPQVTRDRLYLESMQQIYGNVTKVLVDSSKGSNLLYLPLDKIMQTSAQGAAAADAASTAATPVPGATPVPSPLSNEVRARDNSRSRERDAR